MSQLGWGRVREIQDPAMKTVDVLVTADVLPKELLRIWFGGNEIRILVVLEREDAVVNHLHTRLQSRHPVHWSAFLPHYQMRICKSS